MLAPPLRERLLARTLTGGYQPLGFRKREPWAHADWRLAQNIRSGLRMTSYQAFSNFIHAQQDVQRRVTVGSKIPLGPHIDTDDNIASVTLCDRGWQRAKAPQVAE